MTSAMLKIARASFGSLTPTRSDEAVMAMHRKALADFPEALRLYKMMSDDIVRMKKDSEQ